MTNLDVLFTPAEFNLLPRRDLSQTVCVVFDVLRATSTMVTALANGATAILPVAEIAEALALRARLPEVLLAGERDGVRIGADLTGGVEFDLGNSPREFTAERVRGRMIAMSTTNGTRALRACAAARDVLIGSLLNLRAVAGWIQRELPPNLVLVCSGTLEQAAMEDALAAGALCDTVWPLYRAGRSSDSALIARQLFLARKNDLAAAVASGRNGRRLLANAELQADVPLCAQRDVFDLVASLQADGAVRKLEA